MKNSFGSKPRGSIFAHFKGGLAQLASLPRRITGSTIGSNLGSINGGLAQLARALHWQCRGHRFESVILHKAVLLGQSFFVL